MYLDDKLLLLLEPIYKINFQSNKKVKLFWSEIFQKAYYTIWDIIVTNIKLKLTYPPL